MAMLAKDNSAEVEALLKKVRPFLGTVDSWLKSDMLEVLRTASIASPDLKKAFTDKKSLSNELEGARDVLRDDPHNMMKIAKLGLLYAEKCRWSMAMNVMLRGWKRVSEFTDPRLRRAFLTKLAEASLLEGKCLQAAAVLKDLDEEPTERNELKSLQLLRIHAEAGSKQIEKALKALSSAIEGEDHVLVVRIWALSSQSLARTGMFEAAKAVVEGVLGQVTPRSGHGTASAMDTVNHYADALKRAEETKKSMTFMQKMENQDFAYKVIMGTGVGFAVFIFSGFFYWLEQRSLASMSLSSA
jgi:tRNA threonylcarbamoyladenosine modification (KEOPS) complex Cgi121 subunit